MRSTAGGSVPILCNVIFQPYTEKRDHIRTPALSQISRGAHSSNFWKARYNAVLIFLCEPPFVAVTTVATFLPESSSIMICAAIVREHRIFAEFHVKNASLQRDFLQLDRFEVKFHFSEKRIQDYPLGPCLFRGLVIEYGGLLSILQ